MAPNYQNEVEEMASTDQENFFDTPVIEVPPSAPQAHRAVITSVTLKTIATREDWPVVEIGVTSRDVPTLDDKLLKASFLELQKVTPSPPVVSRAIIENSEKFNVDAGLLKADEALKSYDGLFTNEFVQ